MRPAPIVLALCALLSGCGDNTQMAPTPVIPIVQGVWTGDYQIANCIEQGASGSCSATGFGVGRVLPIRLALNQNGPQLSGTAELGSISIPVTGTINSAGAITLGGSGVTSFNGFPTTSTIVNWSSTASGSSMTGQWRTTIAPTGLPGSIILDSNIRVLTKTG
jgi:uncharacterized protein YceK